MARFRNVSGDTRFVPEATPQVVDDGDVFEVDDSRAEAFTEQPWFVPEAPAKKAASAAKED